MDELAALSGSEVIDTGARKAQSDAAKHIACPVCRTAMIRMVHPRQSHIWYESCATCYGALLDAGEFRDLKDETLIDAIKSFFARERRP